MLITDLEPNIQISNNNHRGGLDLGIQLNSGPKYQVSTRDGQGTGTQETGNGYLGSRSGTEGTGTQNENSFRNEKEREPDCVPLRSRFFLKIQNFSKKERDRKSVPEPKEREPNCVPFRSRFF